MYKLKYDSIYIRSNMGRPAKENKVVTTSMTIAESIVKDLHKAKPRNRTLGDFVNILLGSYKQDKAELEDLKEALSTEKSRNDFLSSQIKIKDKIIQEQKEVIEVREKDTIELEKRRRMQQ